MPFTKTNVTPKKAMVGEADRSAFEKMALEKVNGSFMVFTSKKREFIYE